MVDLPQHEAIVSIMLNLHNRNFNFDSYYNWAPARTLYIAPYVMGFALSHFMSVSCAMHIIVFCAVLSYLIGILLCLRALSRPAYLGLLAMPFVYNQSFYWGFVNFNLAIGLAFIALSLLIGNWSTLKTFLFVVVSIATALTHVYGLVLLGSYMGLWLLLGERRAALSRVVALIPAALALAVWLVLVSNAHGFQEFRWGGLANRWSNFLQAIAGGWRDNSEVIFLCCIFVIIMAFSWRTVPITPSRWKETEPSSAGSLGIHKHTLGSLFQYAGIACRGQQGQFSPRRNGGTCTTTYRGFRGRECSLNMVTFGSHCFGLGGNGQQLVPL